MSENNEVDVTPEVVKAMAPLPTTIEELDRLRLALLDERIKTMELQSAALQGQFEKLAAERKTAWGTIAQKYQLTEKDSFHRETGAIKRGE
jgi:hypothetical protein